MHRISFPSVAVETSISASGKPKPKRVCLAKNQQSLPIYLVLFFFDSQLSLEPGVEEVRAGLVYGVVEMLSVVELANKNPIVLQVTQFILNQKHYM